MVPEDRPELYPVRLPPSREDTFHQRAAQSEFPTRSPGWCTGMESLLDCLLDFAPRNGLAALRVNRQRPCRGALRVHTLPTPWARLENPARFPHRSSMKKEISSRSRSL